MNTVLTNPLFKWIFGPAEKKIQTDGFRKTAKSILDRAHARLLIRGKTKQIQDVLKKSPVVVVANHPTSASVLALIASLEDRPDLHLIISSKFVGSSPTIDRHLIPAYIQHHFSSKRNPIIDCVFGKYIPGLSAEEEHVQNRKSIQTAASIVHGGGAVVLFPGYPDHDTGGWYSGVGHLLTQIERKDVVVLFAKINEYSWISYLRFIPLLGALLPPITISFLGIHYLRDLPSDTPKKLVKSLEEYYRFLEFQFI